MGASLLSRRCLLGLVGVALLGCATKVHTEATEGYDVASLATYAWATDELVMIRVGDDQPEVRTEDNERRLRTAIDAALEKRGYVQAPREQADLLVAFSVGTLVRYRLEGGSGRTVADLQPGQQQTKGTLHVYLLHRGKNQEAWHGWTSQWLNPSGAPGAVIDAAVQRIMAQLPAHAG